MDHSCVTACTHNPLGVKGCGEAGAIGSPPAVINAVLDALARGGYDVPHMDMPASPDRVWAAMQGGRANMGSEIPNARSTETAEDRSVGGAA